MASRKPPESYKKNQGWNPDNIFVAILVQTMTSKRHFKINWPLIKSRSLGVSGFLLLNFFTSQFFSPVQLCIVSRLGDNRKMEILLIYVFVIFVPWNWKHNFFEPGHWLDRFSFSITAFSTKQVYELW